MRLLLLLLAGCGLGLVAMGPCRRHADRGLPEEVDLRADFEKYGLTPKAQGARDGCSVFAIAALAEFELAKRDPQRPRRLSEEYLIWAANEATGETAEGALFYQATHGLQTLGISADTLMPYQDTWDPGRRPSAEAIADARTRRGWTVRWIKRWDLQGGLSDGQLLATKRELAAGHPVAVGFRWPIQARLSSDQVLETPSAEGVFDGHSVVLVGYRDDASREGGGLFLLRNSFGTHWGDGGHALLTYAYARANANDALSLRPAASTAAPPLRLEAEDLRVIEAARCRASIQEMTPWGSKLWGGGEQLYGRCEDGGAVEVEFSVHRGANYRVELLATCAPDYGRVQVLVDGRSVGPVSDLYGGRVYPSGPLELGTVRLEAGTHHLRLGVAGRKDASSGYAFGVDSILLRPVE